ncbi:hypothetical protein PFISCL1PPCAC_4114, partial [Pristionchus fissidentatus]
SSYCHGTLTFMVFSDDNINLFVQSSINTFNLWSMLLILSVVLLSTSVYATPVIGELQEFEQFRLGCGGYLCYQNTNSVSIRQAKRIVNAMEVKINQYFGEANQTAIAELYHDDCVIVDKQTQSANFGKQGVITTNSALAKGQAMVWTTTNKALDVGATHIVISGNGALFVHADNATYSGTFKQTLQRFGQQWLLIYELFDLV